MKRQYFLPVLVMLSSAVVVFAQDSKREGLIGVRAMRVVIQPLDTDAKEGL